MSETDRNFQFLPMTIKAKEEGLNKIIGLKR